MNKFDIDTLVNDMVIKTQMELDKANDREDLYSLYGEISNIIKISAPEKETLIYTYSSLMDREQRMYIPFEAYEAGVFAGYGNDYCSKDKDFYRYLCALQLREENRTILHEKEMVFIELSTLLGEAHGIMMEFNELYLQCNGIIGRNLSDFYDLGYATTCMNNIMLAVV